MDAISQQEAELKWMEAGNVFTPGSPVSTRDLFAGRRDQLQEIMGAISQRGYHAVLYGERGVGKTSLSNILVTILGAMPQASLIGRVNCDAGDTFSSIWHKALRDISFTNPQRGIGFNAADTVAHTPVSATLPTVVQPDDIRRTLSDLSRHARVLIILDEYDRIVDRQVATLVSDTIKALSDFGVDATVLIIGVADTIDDLIEGHQSIERAVVQIPMPRMSDEEIAEILDTGVSKLGMQMDGGARAHLVHLTQGLPYVAHLLGLHTTRVALQGHARTITRSHADQGIQRSLEQWQQSIRTAYVDAIRSPQPVNLFKEVLLACALAETDELGYFSASSIRAPLKQITGRLLDIPSFARHLKEFSTEGRGGIIERVGTARKLRYRFTSPLMRPYIIMRGYDDGLLK
ncbi:ATP-binding protein [Dyella sp. C11]|uniref:AAA family ATPase n=1 Tax=Dyella sp. C11 TaxID=2126991 RepID=UPI0013009110|nr:ATP-binding protein [Dyella sp. C11]